MSPFMLGFFFLIFKHEKLNHVVCLSIYSFFPPSFMKSYQLVQSYLHFSSSHISWSFFPLFILSCSFWVSSSILSSLIHSSVMSLLIPITVLIYFTSIPHSSFWTFSPCFLFITSYSCFILLISTLIMHALNSWNILLQ